MDRASPSCVEGEKVTRTNSATLQGRLIWRFRVDEHELFSAQIESTCHPKVVELCDSYTVAGTLLGDSHVYLGTFKVLIRVIARLDAKARKFGKDVLVCQNEIWDARYNYRNPAEVGENWGSKLAVQIITRCHFIAGAFGQFQTLQISFQIFVGNIFLHCVTAVCSTVNK